MVLTGDLNAKDCDELAGIARTLVRLLSSPTHPLLWSVMDAPTSATTVTEERNLRIDYLLYQVPHLPAQHMPAPIPQLDTVLHRSNGTHHAPRSTTHPTRAKHPRENMVWLVRNC